MTKPEIGDANEVSSVVDFLFEMDFEVHESEKESGHEFGRLIETTKLQMIDGTAYKYWHGSLYEKGHVRRWGKIGTKGTERPFPAGSSYEAREQYEKMIRSKLNKGYEKAERTDAEMHVR